MYLCVVYFQKVNHILKISDFFNLVILHVSISSNLIVNIQNFI